MRGWFAPRAITFVSEKQRPQASCRTSSSSGPNEGTSTSSTRRLSRPCPYRCHRSILSGTDGSGIIPILLPPPLIQRDVLPYTLQLLLIPDNVLMIVPLPEESAGRQSVSINLARSRLLES